MDFYAEVLRSKAPFIAANWAVAVIVGTLLIGAFVAFFCTKSKGSGEGSKTKENNLARQKPREKDDDPMVEFENSAPEADLTAPPLHSADIAGLYPFQRKSETEMRERAAEFYREMNRRRSIRDFSSATKTL